MNTFWIAYIAVLNPEEVQSRYDKNICDTGVDIVATKNID